MPERLARPGTSAGDDLRPLGGRGVVRLQDEAGEAELREAVGERDVVDPPRAARRARRGRAGRRRRARARAPARSGASDRPLIAIAGTLSPPRRETCEAGRGSRSRSAARPRARCRSSHAASISSTRARGVRAAAFEQAFEQRRADHRGDLRARATRPCPAASAASMLSIAAAARPFMKTERSELQRGGVARPVRDDLDRHPERSEEHRRTLARRRRRRAPAWQPACRAPGPSSATSAKRAPAPADELRELALQLRARRCSGRRRRRRPERGQRGLARGRARPSPS